MIMNKLQNDYFNDEMMVIELPCNDKTVKYVLLSTEKKTFQKCRKIYRKRG